jgi:hypothetical protein
MRLKRPKLRILDRSSESYTAVSIKTVHLSCNELDEEMEWKTFVYHVVITAMRARRELKYVFINNSKVMYNNLFLL